MSKLKPCVKLLIAGSREFDDYDLLKEHADFWIAELGSVDLEILSGGARGADTLAERFAIQRGYRFKLFPADWQRHGKRAGPIRNQKMADYCTHALIFWDGQSRGAKNMIKLLNVPTEIVRYKDLQMEIAGINIPIGTE